MKRAKVDAQTIRARVLEQRPSGCITAPDGACQPNEDGSRCACDDHEVCVGWLRGRLVQLGDRPADCYDRRQLAQRVRGRTPR